MAPNAPFLFPHLISTSTPPTSRQVILAYNALLEAQLRAGTVRPLVLPYHLYSLNLLVLYLLVPHTRSPFIYALRWPVLGIICWFQWHTIWETRSMAFGSGFAAGLISVWSVVWSATWLIFRRPQWDAKKVSRRVVERKRNVKVGYIPTSPKARLIHGGQTEIKEVEEYYWQSYPSTLSARIPWTLDLLLSFRGTGWNWAIPPLPSLPPEIIHSLRDRITRYSMSPHSHTGLRRYSTRRELLQATLPRFIIGYILLDALRTYLPCDPYFLFGPTTYALPAPLAALHPLALQILRSVLTGISVVAALECIFFIPILLFTSLPGIWGEAWMYPSSFGSLSTVATHGLAGLWGGYWHQTFRLAFSGPSYYLLHHRFMRRGSMTAKIVGLVSAFAISGALHAGGSITQLPPTKPGNLPIFFLLQALGIVLQDFLSALLLPLLHRVSSPKQETPYAVSKPHLRHQTIRHTANVVFATAWLLLTGPFIADDFARGGIWLFEPVPLSFFRGMGWGEKDTGLVCWRIMGWVGRYEGGWWERGFTL